jgi:ribosomal protein S16
VRLSHKGKRKFFLERIAMANERKARRGARDSITGEFIPIKKAKEHPKTTQVENIPLPGHGDTGRGKKGKK